MDCTIYVAKTKTLISFAVTAKLICVFVFAYAKCLFSYDGAQIILAAINFCNFVFRNICGDLFSWTVKLDYAGKVYIKSIWTLSHHFIFREFLFLTKINGSGEKK